MIKVERGPHKNKGFDELTFAELAATIIWYEKELSEEEAKTELAKKEVKVESVVQWAGINPIMTFCIVLAALSVIGSIFEGIGKLMRWMV